MLLAIRKKVEIVRQEGTETENREIEKMLIVYHITQTQTQTPTNTQTKIIQADIENKKDLMYIYKRKFNKSL